MENKPSVIEAKLIPIIRDFLLEMKADRASRVLTLDAHLESDLGIDSLGKMELFHRVEKLFHIQLSEASMGKIETLSELVTAIKNANPPKAIMAQAIIEPLAQTRIDPLTSKTLVESLRMHAEFEPNRPHIYLQDEYGAEQVINYGQLLNAARRNAVGLINLGFQPGETAAIMLPTSEQFFYAFFGILLAGGVPVPIYPPFRMDRIEEYAKREAIILRDAEVRALITFDKAVTLSKLLQTFIPSLKSVVTVDTLMALQGELPEIPIEAEDPALIQYTSGSTGDPKGVLLNHRNLITNLSTAGSTLNVGPTDAMVSWLPLYHDMGLIGTWLGSLYYGIPITIMSPLIFLARPERWLWAIHYHRGTISAAPNFAYELCLRNIRKESIEGLDLSSWRLAFNGAEAVNPKTLERFIKKFSAYGFKAESMFPVYGLAESTVALAFPELEQGPKIDRIAREEFAKEHSAVAVPASEKNALEFVCCGKAIANHQIRIVDKNGQPLEERKIGQLQFRGPSAMQGYYHNPEKTKAIFQNGWWYSGDYAYMVDGEIYITGRKKDVIIIAGRNIYPEEVEDLTAEIEGVRKGCVVAFGVTDAKRGTEKFLIVAETHEKDKHIRDQICAEVTEKIVTAIGIPPNQVILLAPRTIPKTSSGKLKRASCKDSYIKGKLTRRGLGTGFQFAKLFLAGAFNKLKSWIGTAARVVYAIYISIFLLISIPLVWLLVVLSPKRIACNIIRYWSRALLFVVACPVSVEGREHLSKYSPMVLVSNHASYIDPIVLLALLKECPTFIGKKELLKIPILRSCMKKMGCIAVDRIDFSKSLQETQQIVATLEQKESIAIFPEGTFAYATGLRPFKSGAFKVAVDSATPICPITLNGTRKILRGNYLLPRPGKIKVTISEPIVPQSKDWQEVIRLHTAVRSEIAKYCGESSIDLASAVIQR